MSNKIVVSIKYCKFTPVGRSVDILGIRIVMLVLTNRFMVRKAMV